MPEPPRAPSSALERVADELAELIADRVVSRLARVVADGGRSSPWLRTEEAIAYSGLAEGTFRKLAASGKIPSHGARSKVFFRPEIDEALHAFHGLSEKRHGLRRIQ